MFHQRSMTQDQGIIYLIHGTYSKRTNTEGTWCLIDREYLVVVSGCGPLNRFEPTKRRLSGMIGKVKYTFDLPHWFAVESRYHIYVKGLCLQCSGYISISGDWSNHERSARSCVYVCHQHLGESWLDQLFSIICRSNCALLRWASRRSTFNINVELIPPTPRA
jgi:hypothetical protein